MLGIASNTFEKLKVMKEGIGGEAGVMSNEERRGRKELQSANL